MDGLSAPMLLRRFLDDYAYLIMATCIAIKVPPGDTPCRQANFATLFHLALDLIASEFLPFNTMSGVSFFLLHILFAVVNPCFRTVPGNP